MKNKFDFKLLFAFLLIFAILFVSGGCGGGGDDDGYGENDSGTQPPSESENLAEPIGFELAEGEHIIAENVVFNDNVYRVKTGVEYDVNGILWVDPEAIVYVGDTQSEIVPAQLKIGDVLLVDPSDTFPAGLQIVIQNITNQNDMYAITSSSASMNDIFESMDFSMELVYDGRFMDSSNSSSASRSENVNTLAEPVFKPIINGDGGTGGSFEVTYSENGATLSFTAKLVAKITSSKTEGFDCTLELTSTVGANGRMGKEVDLLAGYGEKFTPVNFWLANVPCGFKITPKLPVKVELSSELKGTFTSVFKMGAKGSEQKNTGLEAPSGVNESTGFEFDSSSSLEASFKPSIECYIYGGHEGAVDISTGITITPGCDFTLKRDEAASEIRYSMYGKLNGSLGFRAHAGFQFWDLGLEIEYEKNFSFSSPEEPLFQVYPWGVTPTQPQPTNPSAPTAPVITTASLPVGAVGAAYNQTLAASGTTPITWAIASGSLPGGLTLNQFTGVISGTSSTPGTFNFTVRATNAGGITMKELSISITPAGQTPPTNPVGNWIDVADTSWYDNNPNTVSYTITTAAQLAGLAKLVSDDSTFSAFEGKIFTLGANINLSGRAWIPIGGVSVVGFSGVFDGAGYKITGLSVYNEYLNAAYRWGLFGSAYEAIIKNLSVEGELISDKYRLGGIVGNSLRSTIENCKFKGSIYAATTYCGGIVGESINTTIRNCAVSGSIQSHAITGGIAGLLQTTDSATLVSSISSCSFDGDVKCNGFGPGGGIVGYVTTFSPSFKSKVVNCTSSGSVSDGNDPSGGVAGIGGIAGASFSSEITGCSSTSVLKGGIHTHVGNITGYEMK